MHIKRKMGQEQINTKHKLNSVSNVGIDGLRLGGQNLIVHTD